MIWIPLFERSSLNWIANKSVWPSSWVARSFDSHSELTDSGWLTCLVKFQPGHSTVYTQSSDLGGILVKLSYLADMYGLLFKAVHFGVDWPFEVILYFPFLRLRAILAIMHSIVLTFSAIPVDFFSYTCALSELIEMIKIMMNLFSMLQHILEVYSINCVWHIHIPTLLQMLSGL